MAKLGIAASSKDRPLRTKARAPARSASSRSNGGRLSTARRAFDITDPAGLLSFARGETAEPLAPPAPSVSAAPVAAFAPRDGEAIARVSCAGVVLRRAAKAQSAPRA